MKYLLSIIGAVFVFTACVSEAPAQGAAVIRGEISAGNYRNFATDSSGNFLVAGATGTPTSNVISTVNSSVANLSGGASFTGTSEDISQYSEVKVVVFADQASATDGLSMQQSQNGTDWDTSDVFTIPASTSKTFGVGVGARYFRVVYTNGATPTTAFRLQTTYHYVRTKPSSVRPQDARSNDNDFEEMLAYNMVYNGTSWDRLRGTTNGMQVLGPGANAATAVGNPIRVAGKVSLGNESGLANGETSDLITTDGGSLVVKLFAPEDVDWNYAAASGGITNTSDVAIKTAAGGGISNYVTGLTVVNAAAAVATEVVVKDGSTIIWRGWVNNSTLPGNSLSVVFATPLKGSPNTAMNVAAITTAAQLYVNAQGYTSR